MEICAPAEAAHSVQENNTGGSLKPSQTETQVCPEAIHVLSLSSFFVRTKSPPGPTALQLPQKPPPKPLLS